MSESQTLEPMLSDLMAVVSPTHCCGSNGQPVTHLSHDSRQVGVGGVYVALKGKRHDGHAYLASAYGRGAVAAVGQDPFTPPPGRAYVRVTDSRLALSQLAAAFYGHPTRLLWTVGVTGTKGKTSVAHFCAAALGDALCLSTINNAAMGLPNTTPESLDIQRLAHAALGQYRSLVLEASAHGLAHHRVHDVDVDVAVFTNLSQDHFDDFDGFEPYFEAKAQLFVRTPPPRVALINVDDPYGRRLIERTSAETISYGLSPGAQIHACQVELGPHGSRFLVCTPRGRFPLRTRMPGRFNVVNLLAAAGVGVCAGLPLETIRSRLQRVHHLDGRCERLRTVAGVNVVVDFAHSPDSLDQMIAFLKDHYPRVITLFGCGGESDPHKRPLMGRISGRRSDITILTHDNPKREDPMKILAQIEVGVRAETSEYEVVPDRAAAISRALDLARPGECVLVAGKGHETTQVFSDEVLAFSDRDYLIERCGAVPH